MGPSVYGEDQYKKDLAIAGRVLGEELVWENLDKRTIQLHTLSLVNQVKTKGVGLKGRILKQKEMFEIYVGGWGFWPKQVTFLDEEGVWSG